MTSTLYLTRTGLLEPLGQSQVLAYLRGLSDEYRITLISLEREADLADSEQVAQIQSQCVAHGIRWVCLRYRQSPRVLASSLNLAALILQAYREARRAKVRLIHARSYIPAVAARTVSMFTGIPYVFDMRSLWPEELITSGRLRRGSLLHRLIFRAEGRLIGDAAMVVSLTRVAVRYLDEVHVGKLSDSRTRVIPTCTDLDRFKPLTDEQASGYLIGCHGSLLNGWFRVDLLAAMFSRLAERLPDARFEIISREDPGKILTALNVLPEFQARPEGRPNSGTWLDRLTISSAKASEIHGRLQRQSLSVFFYSSGAPSELGRSPTRMGEALGCGVPVVTNRGVGDVAETVRDGNVGVVLEDESSAALDRAADHAIALLSDPEAPLRCRDVAARIYSLDAGVGSYRRIYRELAGQ